MNRYTMFEPRSRPQAGDGRGWLILAGSGLAVLASAGWALYHRRQRQAVGAFAEIVPADQARTEAQWTRQAGVHSSSSKE